MPETIPGTTIDMEEARQAYIDSGERVKEAIASKETARQEYENSLNETVRGGIIIDSIKTDKYGNPWVEFEINSDVHKSFLEEGKIEALPEGGIYSVTIGPGGYQPLLGQTTEDVKIIVPDADEASKREDEGSDDDYEAFQKALLYEPVVYFALDGQLFKTPLSGLEWHSAAESEVEVGASGA